MDFKNVSLFLVFLDINSVSCIWGRKQTESQESKMILDLVVVPQVSTYTQTICLWAIQSRLHDPE